MIMLPGEDNLNIIYLGSLLEADISTQMIVKVEKKSLAHSRTKI